MRHFLCIFIVMVATITASAAVAQDVADYVRIQPRPSWTVSVKAPDVDKEASAGRDIVYALLDYQNRYDRKTDIYSSRVVMDLLTPSAVEEKGTLTFDFDPSYESVVLHHVRIVRDGTTIDAMDLSEAMVFRTETDRSQMIFNGTLTFAIPLLGLRIGDRVDYAYTQSGRNLAIGEGFLSRRTFGSLSDTRRYFNRLMFRYDIPLNEKAINNPPEPMRSEDGGWTILQWDSPDPEAPYYDDNTPSWTYSRPTYEITPFESWSAVGELFRRSYDVTSEDQAAVRDIVAEIAAGSDDPKVRTRKALDWVQTNIRYVGLELGEGGFIPRPPERVLRRRFGDCKDVTRLLLALLDGLDVSADPILVNSSERGGEFKGLPHPYAFDHIKVVAEIDGALYPLDATRTPQLGALDRIDKGDIAYGLRMADDGSRVTRLPSSDYDYREFVTERFDLVSKPGEIGYNFTLRERGEDADATRDWIARDGSDNVVESFVRYLADSYPTIEPVGEMRFESDADEGWTEISMDFRLPGYGGGDRDELETRAMYVLSNAPDFEGGDRTLPFAIDHPRASRHVREYIVDDRYSFDTFEKTVETNAFRFEARDTVTPTLFREDYRWTSKADHITADDFKADMATVQTLRDVSYSTINLADDTKVSQQAEGPSPLRRAVGWSVLILFPLVVILAMRRSRRRPVSNP